MKEPEWLRESLKIPTYDEIEKAREYIQQWAPSPFLRGDGQDERAELSIEELAFLIGTAPTIGIQLKPVKLGMRRSVQIMLRIAIKCGLLMGLYIAERREIERVNEIREKYGLPDYVPPPKL